MMDFRQAYKKNVTVNSEHRTPEEVISLIKEMDFVVATRMHMMIMALCAGVPVLPISYEFKTTELSKDLKIDRLLSDIEEVTPEDLCKKADLLLGDFQEWATLTMQGVLEQYRSAMRAVPLIQKALGLPQIEQNPGLSAEKETSEAPEARSSRAA